LDFFPGKFEHDCLSAVMGSTREARQAGTRQAVKATAANRTDTPESVKGSMGSVAKSIEKQSGPASIAFKLAGCNVEAGDVFVGVNIQRPTSNVQHSTVNIGKGAKPLL